VGHTQVEAVLGGIRPPELLLAEAAVLGMELTQIPVLLQVEMPLPIQALVVVALVAAVRLVQEVLAVQE
jgi:hypothetical protein